MINTMIYIYIYISNKSGIIIVSGDVNKKVIKILTVGKEKKNLGLKKWKQWTPSGERWE